MIQTSRYRRMHAPRYWRYYFRHLYIGGHCQVQVQRTPCPVMIRQLPLLFLAGLAAELTSIIVAGNLLGLISTLLLLVAAGIFGIGLIRSAGLGVIAAMRSPHQDPSLQENAAGQGVARAVSGLFFLLPGFFSDVIGILLLFPPVRRWLRSILAIHRFSTSRASGGHAGTIIEAEAVEIESELHLPGQPSNGCSGGTDNR